MIQLVSIYQRLVEETDQEYADQFSKEIILFASNCCNLEKVSRPMLATDRFTEEKLLIAYACGKTNGYLTKDKCLFSPEETSVVNVVAEILITNYRINNT